MLTQYKELYDWQTWKIAEVQFPNGVVALDVDAPNKRFVDGNLHDVMVEQVNRLADQLSEKYGLGRYWVYETGSPGCHVIFENLIDDWPCALYDANANVGWHECTGHYDICKADQVCKLRVGHKPGRDWDIFAWETNPTAKPDHVLEHEELLKRKLAAKLV